MTFHTQYSAHILHRGCTQGIHILLLLHLLLSLKDLIFHPKFFLILTLTYFVFILAARFPGSPCLGLLPLLLLPLLILPLLLLLLLLLLPLIALLLCC
jgi:hypothetical protein